ncbi:hypothetical protein M0813_03414 [Anaeramoeba flamelloides]|uniref:RING-type domain-containing protein n=1 Tax=Anaeramoeba flamelloides TaxID=1746091 RepID=A0ABQ8XWL9_9EUKA|nr:hypothetical protein M0813_03414 [Anaeramoeba flamelloides]
MAEEFLKWIKCNKCLESLPTKNSKLTSCGHFFCEKCLPIEHNCWFSCPKCNNQATCTPFNKNFQQLPLEVLKYFQNPIPQIKQLIDLLSFQEDQKNCFCEYVTLLEQKNLNLETDNLKLQNKIKILKNQNDILVKNLNQQKNVKDTEIDKNGAETYLGENKNNQKVEEINSERFMFTFSKNNSRNEYCQTPFYQGFNESHNKKPQRQKKLKTKRSFRKKSDYYSKILAFNQKSRSFINPYLQKLVSNKIKDNGKNTQNKYHKSRSQENDLKNKNSLSFIKPSKNTLIYKKNLKKYNQKNTSIQQKESDKNQISHRKRFPKYQPVQEYHSHTKKFIENLTIDTMPKRLYRSKDTLSFLTKQDD